MSTTRRAAPSISAHAPEIVTATMSTNTPSGSSIPPSMGPGAHPLQPGERPDTGGLLQEITEIRSHYNVHILSDAIDLAYELKGQQRQYHLAFNKMPLGPWTQRLCYGGSNAAAVSGTLLIDLIRGTENASGRQITQEEAEGIAFYSSRRMMTMYVGQVTAMGLGLGSAWYGRKTMKFPFRNPKPIENYNNFPGRALPILKGQYARIMWHITRANIYIVMWLFLTNPFFRSMADTRMTVGLYQDPRTHGLTNLLKGKFDRLRSNRARESAVGSVPQPQIQNEQDDASPSTFYDTTNTDSDNSYAGDTSFTDGNTDTGLITDQTMQQRETRQTSPNAWSNAQNRASRSTQDQQQKSSPTDYLFDDASPTAGNDPDMSTSQQYNSQSTRNAWSRIRGAGATQNDDNTYNQQSEQSQRQDESFSYTDPDQNRMQRTQEKRRAQREFDQMLDRERREGGSADYDRDMRATVTEQVSTSGTGTESAWSKYRKNK